VSAPFPSRGAELMRGCVSLPVSHTGAKHRAASAASLTMTLVIITYGYYYGR